MGFNKKLIDIVKQVREFNQEYSAEIEDADIDNNIQQAIESLYSALKYVTYSQPKEHANSSRENYKDYMAEERATTDRAN